MRRIQSRRLPRLRSVQTQYAPNSDLVFLWSHAHRQYPVPTPPIGWAVVTTGDFNNDGKPDYVLYNAMTHQTVVWIEQQRLYRRGLWADYSCGLERAGGCGFNRDGKIRLPAVQSEHPSNSDLLFVWSHVYWQYLRSDAPIGWAVVTTGDFNNDGKPDYVLYNASTHQTVVWYLNNYVYIGGAYGPTLPAGWRVAAP